MKLTRVSLGETVLNATIGSANTTVTRMMAAQYAGSSREAREAKNERSGRPQPLMQMTKPLITKNTWTPRQPYAKYPCSTGNWWRGEPPQAFATSPSRPP